MNRVDKIIVSEAQSSLFCTPSASNKSLLYIERGTLYLQLLTFLERERESK